MSSRAAGLVALLLAGCGRADPAPAVVGQAEGVAARAETPPPRPAAPRAANTAATAAVTFLVKQQSPDGAWRSDVYAAFKDGTALTPLVLTALQDVVDAGFPGPDTAAERRKAADFLDAFVADGAVREPPGGFDYPVYTAALTLQALSHPENRNRGAAKAAWTSYLLARQLAEANGWAPGDAHYGGWGYCRVVPKKPEPGGFAPPLTESNLSATVFALDALRAAGALTPAVARAAEQALHQWQNYVTPTPGPPPGFVSPDGGFFFVLADPVRNKAGLYDVVHPTPGVEPIPRQRFGSYGSATADGLRALLALGGGNPDFRRHRAAVAGQWLRVNFRADSHPGQYAPAMESNRNAVYYYYAASAAKAFRAADLSLPDGRDWTAELGAALVRRQRPDGSWSNAVELVRENDPLVATPQALAALAAARRR
jgi:squalene-hopene/tetraprenyl-beta-curcumene cyclase